jgi:AcrR family transcriptional regulator
LAGLSLRPLAGKIGTSARLLVYHFGSKDGLVAAVMDEVQTRMQRSFTTSAAHAAAKTRKDTMRAFWNWITHPANVSTMRLLFEVQVLALQNPAGYARYLKGTSSSWLELIESSLPPSKAKRAIATLCAAVIDGLLLEYLSTGDRRRTTSALDHFSRMMRGKMRNA